MDRSRGTAVRIVVLFVALLAPLVASGQLVVDYALQLLPSGVAYPTGEVGYALVVTANWSTNDQEPFTVQLTVPPGLELTGTQCFGYPGIVSYDPATRVVTWADRLDNPYIAFNSCPLLFRIDPSVPVGSVYSLTATLTTSKPDPNPSNDTAQASGVVIAVADLEVSSSADRKTLSPGEPIAYTLEVRNAGPQTAYDVILTDYLSFVRFVSFEQISGPPAALDSAPFRDGACFQLQNCSGAINARIPMLPAGSSATFRLVAIADPAYESANIWNRAVARLAAQVDIVERNNQTDVWAYAGPNVDLSIASSLSEASSTRSTIVLQVANNGAETVNQVTVHSILATAASRYDFVDLVRFASVTPSQGTCTTALDDHFAGHPPPPDAWKMDCQLGALAPGAVATIAVVIESSPDAGPFRHAAFVRPGQNDPQPGNTVSEITRGIPRRRAARH